MRIDVQSLDTFNQLAHEGATAATQAMAQMTGIDATVQVTTISLIDRTDLGEELGHDTQYVGIQFDFEGALPGKTILIFDKNQRDTIVEALLPGGMADESMMQSSVKEIGNIMMSGFIDGWAAYLGAGIDHSPPKYIERSGASMFAAAEPGEATNGGAEEANTAAPPAQVAKAAEEEAAAGEVATGETATGEAATGEAAQGDEDQVFVFRSEIHELAEDGACYFYMIPEYAPLASLMAEYSTGEGIPTEKLRAFNEMTRQGAEQAADNIGMMAGIDATAEVSNLSFSPIETVPKQFGEQPYVGTVVKLTGTPSGFLAVMFDEDSAVSIAEALMPVESDGDELTDQHKSAIQELGNIVTSGFIDGWANVLQKSIDHTPPRLVHDMGRAVIEPLVAQLGSQQRHAFVIDSHMVTDDLEFSCDIHALPNEAELVTALEELDLSRTDQTEADAEQLF